MAFSRMTRYAAIAAAAALALAGCARAGDDGEGTDGAGGNGSENTETYIAPGTYKQDEDGGEPVKGGTLTYAEYAETRSLDPTKTIPTASSGGNSLYAVYDVLVRYNHETGEYDPRLAESVEPNDDFTEWTVKLRPDVKFSDGTDLNADAVLGSVGYYLQNQGYDLGVIYPLWEGIEKTDDLTVVFKLKDSWATFNDMLGRGMGFIMAPAAYAGGPDAFEPIGAGAFTLDNYAPGESMTFRANPNYWDGEPNIETLRWVWLGSDETKVESFNSGSVQGGYIRKPGLIKDLRADGVPGQVTLQNNGNLLMLNAADGRPLANEKVRRAIALAIDPSIIYDRAHDGNGMPGNHLFATASKWHNADAEVNAYDPEAATALVEEAKAEGFDGKIGYFGLEDPTAREEAMVIMAQLEAVGLEIEMEMSRSVADFTSKLFIEKNYDLGKAAVQVTENDPYQNLYSVYHSQSAANVLSNNDPEMDALIEELRATPMSDEEAVKDVTKRIEEHYQQTVPSVTLGGNAPMMFWSKDVYGVVVGNEDMIDFSKAWIKQ
ncbi:MAG: ABC transporter substrate-binding protein [Propionibacterium sp.]|nr:ABC transporter substrate-binding protein [Propionibacterium sp.]